MSSIVQNSAAQEAQAKAADQALVQQMMSSDPLPPINWKADNYAYIVMVVLVYIGMGPLNQSMVQIAKEQQAEDKVNSLFLQLTSLLSDIQTSATGNTTGSNNGNITKEVQQMMQIMKKLIGATPSMSGNQQIQPSPGSALYNLIQQLKADHSGENPPYDPFSNPAVASVNSFFNAMQSFQYTGSGSSAWKPSWSGSAPNMFKALRQALNTMSDPPFGQTQNLTTWLDIISTNSYYKTNPGSQTAGTDFLGNLNTNTTATTATFQGMGQQNQALIQTNTTQEGSLDTTGQNIISGNSQQGQAFVRNQSV